MPEQVIRTSLTLNSEPIKLGVFIKEMQRVPAPR